MKSAFCRNKEILDRIKEINPSDSPEYSTDDVGIAKLFSDVFGDICRFNPTAKQFYIYDGTVWKEDVGGMVTESLAKRFYKALYIYAVDTNKYYQKFVAKLGDRKKRTVMITDARDYRYFTSEELDTENYLLNCKNVIVNLKDFSTLEHSPDYLVTKCTNAIYDPEARSEVWERFIEQITEGNTDKADYMQRIFGYSLLGDSSEEELYILYGSTTRNGKTTVLKAVKDCLGTYGVIMSPDTLAQRQRNSSAPQEEIVDLKGSRFVQVEEPSNHMVLDSALVKNLTGGASIKARKLHQANQEFDATYKIYIATNYLPRITDDSIFSSNRIKVLTFDRHFEPHEQDKTLKRQFRKKENASAILNWLLDGLRKYYERGTNPPQVVIDASEQYRNESDKIGNFITDCLIEDRNYNIKAGDVYENVYTKWCKDNGYYCENKANFFEHLKRKQILYPTGTVNNRTEHNVIKGYYVSSRATLEDCPEDEKPF